MKWEENIELREYVIGLRREFHRFPELSGEEKETAGRVIRELEKLGITYQTYPDHYGILGTIEGNGTGPVVALRADMDALSILEDSGLSFASENEGKMHACGHDGHMSKLLGAAKLLMETRDSWKGTVKVFFQPAEELAPQGGARFLINSGVLENPKVDLVFGCHVWPARCSNRICSHSKRLSNGFFRPFWADFERKSLPCCASTSRSGCDCNGSGSDPVKLYDSSSADGPHCARYS